jgi:hypothetical protein
MATIPKDVTELTERIYAHYVKKNEEGGDYLTRIGASSVGDECLRSIWYDWRGAYKSEFSGRLLRLFQTGHIQEERVLEDLKNAGLEVWGFDEDGKQWTYVTARGHAVAKLDGVVRGVPGAEKTPHTLEIKSSNLKGFKETQSKGVKVAKPVHYYQMQMGLALSGLKDSLYVMICKDDEQYYIERVKRDELTIREIEVKLDQLVNSSIPPIRIAEKESDWRCKFCDAKPVCWEGVPMRQNCRTCMYSEPMDEGKWACTKLGTLRTSDEQYKGCDLWESAI